MIRKLTSVALTATLLLTAAGALAGCGAGPVPGAGAPGAQGGQTALFDDTADEYIYDEEVDTGSACSVPEAVA